jgi:hypothetical protein
VELGNDTYFEQLTCVGYNPGRGEVEATVQIKRAGGYGSDLCGPGSREWLRFYVSYDDGATWQDVGLGSFLAHNIPDQPDCAGQPGKPLSYTVAYPLPDPKRRPCPWPVLPLVRAILSAGGRPAAWWWTEPTRSAWNGSTPWAITSTRPSGTP